MSATETTRDDRTAPPAIGSGIAARVGRIRPRVRPSSRPGYEHVRGYGIYSLPFESGHVLALRVFPENDFAPYATVWHRTPDGRWSIYVDGPRHDTACPRYNGAATDVVASATISIEWVDPIALRVRMDDPDLDLQVRMAAPPVVRFLNAIGARVPAWLWRVPGVDRVFARLADAALDVGEVTLRGTAPNGQRASLLPRRMYSIVSGSAVLDGEVLGRPTRSDDSPTLGAVTFPARGILAIGEAYFEILDRDEYERTRAELDATGA